MHVHMDTASIVAEIMTSHDGGDSMQLAVVDPALAQGWQCNPRLKLHAQRCHP